MKVHTNKVCCLLAAHSAVLASKQSPFKRLVIVVLTGRKLIARKEIAHLRNPEGNMFTEEGGNNLTSLVRIDENSALLHHTALYTVTSP